MKKCMPILMIAYYIGMKRKNKKYVINVVVRNGRIVKRNCQLRCYALSFAESNFISSKTMIARQEPAMAIKPRWLSAML